MADSIVTGPSFRAARQLTKISGESKQLTRFWSVGAASLLAQPVTQVQQHSNQDKQRYRAPVSASDLKVKHGVVVPLFLRMHCGHDSDVAPFSRTRSWSGRNRLLQYAVAGRTR